MSTAVREGIRYRLMERIGNREPYPPESYPKSHPQRGTVARWMDKVADQYRGQGCIVRFSNVPDQYAFVAEKDGKFYGSVAIVEAVQS